MSSILALVDNSLYATSVCACASWISLRNGAAIDLVHVVSRAGIVSRRIEMAGPFAVGLAPGFINEVARVSDDEIEHARERGRALLDKMHAELSARGVALVRPRLAMGDLGSIVQETEADAIIMGKRGESADFARLSLGSNLKRLAWSTTKPLFMAPRAFRPALRWLLAFDTDPNIETGINHLVDGDLLPQLPCQIVHVGKPSEEVKDAMAGAQTTLAAAGFAVTIDVVDGDPVRVLPERVVTDEASLVALGGFTGSRLKSLAFGDTASELVRACQTPILLLR